MANALFREAILKTLNEPVPPDPDEDLDITPPPPIDPEKLAAIPKLESLQEMAELGIDINRNIELLQGLDGLALRALELERLKNANGAKRCEHLKLNGKTCGSPALRGGQFCHYHEQAKSPTFDLPVIEDAHSLQVAYTRLAQQVVTEKLKPQQARVLLQILQSAAKNLPEPDEADE